MVVDTDVLVAGLRGGGAANAVLGLCLDGAIEPLVGPALLAEYEDVMRRDTPFRSSTLTVAEREDFLDIFLAQARWVHIYYSWRPNLRDESDNHLVELAIAGGARCIISRNVRDLKAMELRFDDLQIVTPSQLLRSLP
ncbi:MAG: putative toxin-antitoxin system toxin component, PIN family [Steroidobacteraceae bacterium]